MLCTKCGSKQELLFVSWICPTCEHARDLTQIAPIFYQKPFSKVGNFGFPVAWDIIIWREWMDDCE